MKQRQEHSLFDKSYTSFLTTLLSSYRAIFDVSQTAQSLRSRFLFAINHSSRGIQMRYPARVKPAAPGISVGSNHLERNKEKKGKRKEGRKIQSKGKKRWCGWITGSVFRSSCKRKIVWRAISLETQDASKSSVCCNKVRIPGPL